MVVQKLFPRLSIFKIVHSNLPDNKGLLCTHGNNKKSKIVWNNVIFHFDEDRNHDMNRRKLVNITINLFY